MVDMGDDGEVADMADFHRVIGGISCVSVLGG
jgi:hypothetical protein